LRPNKPVNASIVPSGANMKKSFFFAFTVVIAVGCTPVMQVTQFDSKTGSATTTTYAPYFNTRTMLVPDRVGIDLVVDLEKKVVPGVYQVQRSLGALGPGDSDAMGLFTAYVHNLTTAPQTLTISAMSHEHQNAIAAPAIVELKPDSYEKVVLGRVCIFSYATELKVQIVYSVDEKSLVKDLTVRRETPAQIEASVARWKGRKKNVPEFFLD